MEHFFCQSLMQTWIRSRMTKTGDHMRNESVLLVFMLAKMPWWLTIIGTLVNIISREGNHGLSRHKGWLLLFSESRKSLLKNRQGRHWWLCLCSPYKEVCPGFFAVYPAPLHSLIIILIRGCKEKLGCLRSEYIKHHEEVALLLLFLRKVETSIAFLALFWRNEERNRSCLFL